MKMDVVWCNCVSDNIFLNYYWGTDPKNRQHSAWSTWTSLVWDLEALNLTDEGVKTRPSKVRERYADKGMCFVW